ncbi:MAG: Ser/Thr protein phosphatase/nucleotidase, putative [Acetothermia bacterium 64_32]|nr:MAG: Ser/Thr protein phosphatase/nucleotidase, putative [Acetothermia bacterium 64_32]HAF71425.1 multifunctional 2',3'-cyclic-nucleotide 2'-phosphodiesterase/5'-nucleotidase/3'-nucleotidase [Candidatus Acetothermia bacterium]
MRKFYFILIAMLMVGVLGQADWTVVVLHVNDTHSHLDEMARMATLIEEIRSKEEVVLLHAGDAFLGTLYFTVHKGAANAEVMELMGFGAMALGNHEFDLGPAALADFAGRLSFPLLCANCDLAGEPLLLGKVLPYAVLEVGEERLGIVGLITPDTSWSSNPGPNVAFSDPVAAAREAVADLSAQGIDKIVVLSHLGWNEDLKLAEEVAGIDIIVGGHSHTLPEEYPVVVERGLLNLNQATAEELEALPGIGPTLAKRIIQWREEKGPFGRVEDLLEIEGIGPVRLAAIRELVAIGDETARTLVVQAGEHAAYLGRLSVTFDEAGRVTAWQGELVPTEGYPPHPQVEERLAAFREPIEALKGQVIGQTLVDLDGERAHVRSQETNLGNLVADALLWKAQPAGAQVALWNGGGIRASVPAGPVTLGDCMNILPFGNYLVVLEVKGEQVLAALENGVSMVEELKGRFPHVAGLRFVWDPARPAGFRIVSAEVLLEGTWQPLDPAANYRLATSNYLAAGGDGYEMFKEALNSWNLGFVDYEVLAEYVQAHTPVSPQVEGRIVRK